MQYHPTSPELLVHQHHTDWLYAHNPHSMARDTREAMVARVRSAYPQAVLIETQTDPDGTHQALRDGIGAFHEQTDGRHPVGLQIIAGDGSISQIANIALAARRQRAAGEDMDLTEQSLAIMLLAFAPGGNGNDAAREYLTSRMFHQPPMPDTLPFVKRLYPVKLDIDGPAAHLSTSFINYVGLGLSAELMRTIHEHRAQLTAMGPRQRIATERTYVARAAIGNKPFTANGTRHADISIINSNRMAKVLRSRTNHETPGFQLADTPPLTPYRIGELAARCFIRPIMQGSCTRQPTHIVLQTPTGIQIDGEHRGLLDAGTSVTFTPEDIFLEVASARRSAPATHTPAGQYAY